MSVTRIFADVYNVKLSDCKDVLDYTSCYQIAFNKLVSLISTEGWMSWKTVEMTLQRSLLRHLEQNYSAFVSAIETGGTENTTNLSDAILRVIHHAEIPKGNALDNVAEPPKVMVTNTQRAPKGTCTTPECVKRGVTTYYND